MANVKICRIFPHIFYASSYRFRFIKISLFTLRSRSSSRSTILQVRPLDGKCQNLQKTPIYYCGRSHRFKDINISNLLTFKEYVKSTIFAMTSFDGKCQNLQMIPTYFCASSYHFIHIKNFNFLPSESISRSQNTIFEVRHHSNATLNIHKRFTHLQKVGQSHGVQFLK